MEHVMSYRLESIKIELILVAIAMVLKNLSGIHISQKYKLLCCQRMNCKFQKFKKFTE